MDFMKEEKENMPDGGKISQDKMYLTVINRSPWQQNGSKEAIKREISAQLYRIFEKYR